MLITVNSSSVVLLKVSVLTCQPIKSLSYIQHAIFHSFPPPNQHSHLIPCHCTASLVKMSLKQKIYIYYILPLRCSFWILSPKLLSVLFFFFLRVFTNFLRFQEDQAVKSKTTCTVISIQATVMVNMNEHRCMIQKKLLSLMLARKQPAHLVLQ